MHDRTFLIALGALLLCLGSISPAFACSAEPTIETMTDMAEVIALGTLSNPTDDVITLEVDEYLKGPAPTATLLLNNHFFTNVV